MSTHTPPASSYSPAENVTHTREKALSDYEFELLVDESYTLKECQDLEARFILMVCGRLGLRRGELTHFVEEWLNRRKSRIEIPYQEDCDKGRDGGPCGICRQHANQQAEHALAAAAEAAAVYRSDAETANARGIADLERELEKVAERVRLDEDEILELAGETTDYETAYDRLYEAHYDELFAGILAEQWTAKTKNAAREVPYSWNGRSEIVIDRYFDRFDQWMYTGNAVNRRLNWLVEEVDEVDDVTPHALRATAASYIAARNVDVIAMTGLFGWSQLATARNYIKESSDRLDQQLQFLLQ